MGLRGGGVELRGDVLEHGARGVPVPLRRLRPVAMAPSRYRSPHLMNMTMKRAILNMVKTTKHDAVGDRGPLGIILLIWCE